MNDPMGLLLDCVAAYRLTRLVTQDGLLDRPRDLLVQGSYTRAGRAEQAREAMASTNFGRPPQRGDWTAHANADPDPPKLAELITCPWCSGMWVAAAVTVAHRVAPRLWVTARRTLAVAAAAALLQRLED